MFPSSRSEDLRRYNRRRLIGSSTIGSYADAGRTCVAPSTFSQYSFDPGQSSIDHLRENLDAAEPSSAIAEPNAIDPSGTAGHAVS